MCLREQTEIDIPVYGSPQKNNLVSTLFVLSRKRHSETVDATDSTLKKRHGFAFACLKEFSTFRQNEYHLKLLVPFIEAVNFEEPVDRISSMADSWEKNKIENSPWGGYTNQPAVSFAIAHGNNCILLKYFVSEKNIRAVYTKSNEPVYRDTCVEFFISFGDDKAYYNFEFNCIGTCLLGFGAGRADRELLPPQIIRKIITSSVITTTSDSEDINWQLTLVIPFTVFCFHSFTSLKQQAGKGNFYKCGDDLPEPHFLTWNHVGSKVPDFHLPEYFGELNFI